MKIIIKTLALGLLLAIPALAMDDLSKPIRLCKVMGAIGPDLEIDDVNPYSDHCYYAPGSIEEARTRITNGVNYHARCENRHCKAMGGNVYIEVGMVEYLIRNGTYCHPPKCPLCNEDVEVRDWIFCHCCFQIEWRKPRGRGVRDWERADTQAYTISMDELGQAEYETVRIKYLGPKADLPSNDL